MNNSEVAEIGMEIGRLSEGPTYERMGETVKQRKQRKQRKQARQPARQLRQGTNKSNQEKVKKAEIVYNDIYTKAIIAERMRGR